MKRIDDEFEDQETRILSTVVSIIALIAFTWFINWDHPGNWERYERVGVFMIPILYHIIVPYFKNRKRDKNEKDNETS